jgi:protein-S-isoprenylcysteine O-methyltransferase Ste14
LPAFGIAILFVVRTGFEDAFLGRNLPGYAEYSHEVRFRLIPGIW